MSIVTGRNTQQSELNADLLSFDDFEFAWVGPGRTPGLACFGSEDGKLAFQEASGDTSFEYSKKDSREAINGIAFGSNGFAYSTRDEVVVRRYASNGQSKSARLPGAHEVVSIGRDGYVVPRGIRGFQIIEAQSDTLKLVTSRSNPVCNFYKSLFLTRSRRVVFAGRNTALVWVDLSNGAMYQMSPKSDDGRPLDVVSVCEMDSRDGVQVVAALGRTGEILIAPNPSSRLSPAILTYEAFQGVTYQIVCRNGHFFVLTDKELYCVTDLAQNYHLGRDIQNLNVTISNISLPAPAVHMNTIGNYLWVATTAGAFPVDLALFPPMAKDKSAPSIMLNRPTRFHNADGYPTPLIQDPMQELVLI